jgi:hypothetical protein
MNHRFDDLAKGLASGTLSRRRALAVDERCAARERAGLHPWGSFSRAQMPPRGETLSHDCAMLRGARLGTSSRGRRPLHLLRAPPGLGTSPRESSGTEESKNEAPHPLAEEKNRAVTVREEGNEAATTNTSHSEDKQP